MPARLSAAKLSEIQPTAEELEQARKELASLNDKAKDSKKGCMKAFLKNNPDQVAMAAKGEAKEQMLAKFLVHQARNKAGQKNMILAKDFETKRSLQHTLNWWSRETMDRELGENKAAAWRASKILPMRPDRVTKSWDEFAVEYGCPVDIETYTESDLHSLRCKVQSELAQEDLEYMPKLMAFTGFGAPSGALASSSNPVQGKPAEPSATEKMAIRIESLKANVQMTLAKFQGLITHELAIKAKVDGKPPKDRKFVIPLMEDCTKNIAKGEKLCKVLSRMVAEPIADTEMPRILNQMEEIEEKHNDIEEWAERCDCNSSPAKKSRKKK